MRKLYCLSFCVAVLALSGCKEGNPGEANEEEKPLIKKGLTCVDNKQWDEAEKSFKEALDKDPSLAVPHRELARIYRQYKKNLIYSIYHYDRYLEMRPDMETAELFKEQRDQAEKELEIEMVNQSADVKTLYSQHQQLVERYNALLREKNTLSRQLTAVQQGTSSTASTASTATTTRSSAATTRTSATERSSTTATAATATTTGEHQVHTVVSGETLSKIARKYYGDPSNWDVIYNANKDRMRNPNSVKVGMTLIIPAIK